MIEVTQPPRHSSLPDVTSDEHHNKSHAHDGADGSGTVAYSSLSGAPSVPAFATPSVALGTAASAGVANTVIRSDATVLAFDATAPVTQAFSDAAAVGTATVAARRDHKHGMPASPSVPLAASTVTDETSFGVAKAVGTATTFAREDHTHGSPANPVSFGDVRTISTNTTLAADNSWTPVGYCQIASGVSLEIASGAVVEILS